MQKGFAAVLGSLIGVLVIRFGKEIPEFSGLVRHGCSPIRTRLEVGEGAVLRGRLVSEPRQRARPPGHARAGPRKGSRPGRGGGEKKEQAGGE